MATKTTARLAFLVAALLLAAPLAHAEQYCTPQSGWQNVQPGGTITLQCERDGYRHGVPDLACRRHAGRQAVRYRVGNDAGACAGRERATRSVGGPEPYQDSRLPSGGRLFCVYPVSAPTAAPISAR